MSGFKNVKYTKKKKKKRNSSKLWEAFDHEYNPKTQSLELMYSKQDMNSRETCELCDSPLQYSESNYLTCSNNKCSVI